MDAKGPNKKLGLHKIKQLIPANGCCLQDYYQTYKKRLDVMKGKGELCQENGPWILILKYANVKCTISRPTRMA